jgi:hypothetical protein
MPEASPAGLEHLFGSKTRVKLLRLFLHHPDEQFFVRELGRRIGAQIHSVRRELQNLERLGAVVTSGGEGPKGVASSLRKKYYRANTEFVLFEELQSLLRKAQVLLERNLVHRIKSLGSVRYLALCGAFVGEQASTDLLVVGKMPAINLQRLVKRFEHEVGYNINYTFMSPDEFSYRRDITDRFLYSLLEGKKMVMINEFPWSI